VKERGSEIPLTQKQNFLKSHTSGASERDRKERREDEDEKG
jgi:hypothetical protein